MGPAAKICLQLQLHHFLLKSDLDLSILHPENPSLPISNHWHRWAKIFFTKTEGQKKLRTSTFNLIQSIQGFHADQTQIHVEPVVRQFRPNALELQVRDMLSWGSFGWREFKVWWTLWVPRFGTQYYKSAEWTSESVCAKKKKIKLGILQAEREGPVPALVQQDRTPQALMRPIHFIQKVLNDITKVMGPHCIASFPNHIRS